MAASPFRSRHLIGNEVRSDTGGRIFYQMGNRPSLPYLPMRAPTASPRSIWKRERGNTSSRACKLTTCRAGTSFYYASGIYQVVAFDPSRVEDRGSAVPVLASTRGIGSTGSPWRYFDVSDTGIVVSVPGGAIFPKSVLTRLDLDGGVETVPFDSAAIAALVLFLPPCSKK